MATRTSLYLRGGLEEEITLRSRRRLGNTESTSLGHVITRHLNVLFTGYKFCRTHVAETFNYAELRFLCSLISSEGWDEDDFNACLELSDHVHMHWLDMEDDAQQCSIEDMAKAEQEDADWLYWNKINASELEHKIEATHPFIILALIDGLQTALMSDKPERELPRLFRGIKRP